MPSQHIHRLATLIASAAVVATPLQLAPEASAATATSAVSYHGLNLRIPSGWKAVDLAKHPETCVRFDQHTVYLGHPGADQKCPAHITGDRTDSLIVEPFSGAAASVGSPTVTVPAGKPVPRKLTADQGNEIRVAFEGAGLYARANYGSSAATVEKILRSATIGRSAKPMAVPPKPVKKFRRSLAADSSATPSTGYTGKAFDTCSAPSSSAMRDWSASPYRGLGVYIGGTRVCDQPNLSASYVAEQSRAGWHLLPIYGAPRPANIRSGSGAADQGRADAEAAVNQARDLGFVPGTVLYSDMEHYNDRGLRTNVLTYLSAWTQRVQALGFRSGVYTSAASGAGDLASVYNSDSYQRPDVMWTADWNHQADTDEEVLPASYWANHQRVHQYEGESYETYGGTTIQIDRNYVDVGPAAPMDPGMTSLTAGDFNGDGKKDLVAVEVNSGKLFMYPGQGNGRLGDRVEIGNGGWNGMKDLVATDLDGDGKDDLIATEKSTGKLFMYPGTGNGVGDRIEIGRGGWNGLKNLFAGDFNGDGKKDIGATDIATGKLLLYPGRGNRNGLYALGDPVEIGNGGWNEMNKLVSPGDMNGDGKDDLIATETTTGKLFLYPGTGHGLGDRVEIGHGGWNGISGYAGADFNGDGIGDLAAVESDPGQTGKLYFYPGTGKGGLGDRTEIGNGGW
ncbi:glycoside hydrolase domain-containing protein [Streptomyces orinoci]|uniref:Glycoside hydrolase domain-containing protein n=1 Tax=Streptomyces orinoci TaxID=67339 RepID=A0ABV3JWF4_STRON|nr:glycoside hydrolase domain-containing protein [Streptomyces orinoci]